MTTKKEEVIASEQRSLPDLPKKSDRRQSLIDNCVPAILSGLKLDLDKMPSQEGRNKIVNFAVKLADDVIAATPSL